MKSARSPRIAYIRVRKHKKLKPPYVPRSRLLIISDPVGFRYYTTSESIDSLNGSVPAFYSSSGYQSLGLNFRSGTTNPFWKDQTRLGSNATTPLSFTEFSGDDDRSFWSAYSVGTSWLQANNAVRRTWSYSSSGFLSYPAPGQNSAPSDVKTDVHNRCIAKFIDAVNAAQSSENLTGRSIKHFKHDVHSILHPMTRIQDQITQYLAALKIMPVRGVPLRKLYSTITQSYLEFKFGIEPFVEDITDIVQDMVVRDRKRNPSVPVQANASNHYAGQTSLNNSVNDSGYMSVFNPFQNVRITSVYQERIRGAVRTGINDDGRLGVVQDLRLLPKDWAPTAFSIMPYAWMVNYFTNIREIIDAASFRYSDLVWGCSTWRDYTTTDYGNVYFANPNLDKGVSGTFQNFSTVTSGGNATFVVKRGGRLAISPAQLVPSFAFSIPVTSTPWLNMMAAFSPLISKIVGRLTT